MYRNNALPFWNKSSVIYSNEKYKDDATILHHTLIICLLESSCLLI